MDTGKVYVHVPRWLMQEKGFATRDLVGEPVRWTPKAVLVKGHALVEAADNCRRCGKVIKNPASLLVGFGPDCCEHLGIPRDFNEEQLAAVKAAAIQHTQFEAWIPRKYAYSSPERNSWWQPPKEDAPTPKEKAPAAKPATPPVTVVPDLDFNCLDVYLDINNKDFFYRLKERIKQIPGRAWDAGRKCWVVPIDQGEALGQGILEVVGPNIESSDAWVAAAQKAHRKRERRIAASRAVDAELEVEGLGKTLRPYQKAGVLYVTKAKRAWIGDPPGAGKTVQALAAIQHTGSYPAVIVVPANPKYKWEREAHAWLPGKSVELCNGRAKPGWKLTAEITILNYELLASHLDALIAGQPKALVFDEAHRLKNPQAQRSQAFKDLVESCDPELVLLLTGTATKNRTQELIHPLTVLGYMDSLFGNVHQYVQRYVWQHNDVELNEKLRSRCYVRRERPEIHGEIPPVVPVVVPLELANRAEYRRAEVDIIDYLREEAEVQRDFLDSIHYLLTTNEPDDEERYYQAIKRWRLDKSLRAEAAEHLVRFNELKKIVARGKLAAVKRWIKDFLQSGEKLVVFAHHQHVVRELAREFKCGYIDGSVTGKKRDQVNRRFQEDPKARVIVLNMQAGGEGIDLTAAEHVAFVELPWSPSDIEQCEGRVYARANDLHGCTSWYLLAAGTIEEEIAAILDAKKATTDAVNIGIETDEQVGILDLLVQSLLDRDAPAPVAA